MQTNFSIMAAAAVIPLVMGFIWYNPRMFGTAWLKATGLTEEDAKSGNMALIFGVSYLLSFFLANSLNFVVIHQWGIFSILLTVPGFQDGSATELVKYFEDFMVDYGTVGRTFGHGSFHGVVSGVLFATPILATNALFERKGFKYIAINCGYWIVTFALMGGVIAQFG